MKSSVYRSVYKCDNGHRLNLIIGPINDPSYGDGTQFTCEKCK